jgi:antitoxin component YwqK of YwqJK toxin-antitoxin module
VYLGDPITIKDYNSSEYIISGKAVKVTIDERETSNKQVQIEFRIDEVYKGKINLKTVMIYTSRSDASCGLFVKENEEWVIWAYLENKAISTSLCTRSKQKKDIAAADYQSLNYFKSAGSSSEWKNESGVLIAKGQLVNNLPIGYWKYFYTNGYIESEGFYENGLYTGKWIKYLNPKSIVTRLQYDKIIPPDSFPDLQQFQHRIWEIQHYQDGIREGEFIYYAYHSTDKPTHIINYKKGQLDGKSIAYYENGMMYYEQNYKEGKLDGYERFYYVNGQLKQEGKFIQSKAIGEFKLYSETGELIKITVGKRPD